LWFSEIWEEWRVLYIKTYKHSLYYTAEIFHFSNICVFQFAEFISIYNETFALFSINFIYIVNKLVTPVSSFVVPRIFQYYDSKLRYSVVPSYYPETNSRFSNTNFRVLLIMHFNKVLIILSPTKIQHYVKELSVTQNLLSLRDIPSGEKVTNT